jgi:hypothetical protein
MVCTTGCDISSIPNPQQQSQKPMCPTRMSDGRAFTDYRPRCVVNAEENAKNTHFYSVILSESDPQYPQPDGITTQLKPHQLAGLRLACVQAILDSGPIINDY